MSLNKFINNDLVILKDGIYKITQINTNSNDIVYSLELLAYFESSTGSIDTTISKKIEAREADLEKFEYASPRYPIGTRLSGGKEVYLAVFKNDTHTYRYNVSGDDSILANLPEEDVAWS